MDLLRWFRSEHRASSYESLIVRHLQSTVDNANAANVGSLAVLEMAAGFYGRAFAVADVSPEGFRTRGLQASTLSLIARSMIRDGECVLIPEIGPGGLAMLPAADWDIMGGPNPGTWRYRVTLPGPTAMRMKTLPAAAVLHFQYAENPAQPWRALSPMQAASLTGRIAANLELRLGDETRSRTGQLLPIAGDPSDPRFDDLKADLSGLRGDTAMVPLMGGGELGPQRQTCLLYTSPSPRDS